MSGRTVLIITHAGDTTANLVEEALRTRDCTPVRLDTDRFPTEVLLRLRQGGGTEGVLAGADAQAGWDRDLLDVDAVWYRRFHSPSFGNELDEKWRKYCRWEQQAVLTGMWSCLRHVPWVDPVDRIWTAHHKSLQMELARQCGLRVPDTLVTNDPDAVRAFADEHPGGIVTKMLSSFSLTDDADDLELTVFTSTVTEDDLADLDGLRWAPMVFQEKLDKALEYRVTVVGDRLFTASIDARNDDGTVKDDWRKGGVGMAVRFERAELPGDVADAVLALMRRFGLIYGAVDLVRTPDGNFHFLEINSAGEWGWIQTEVGHPVADALADVLSGRTPVDRDAPDLRLRH